MQRLPLTAQYVTPHTNTESDYTGLAQALNRAMADSWSARATYGLTYGRPWTPWAPAGQVMDTARLARSAAGTVR